MPANLPEYARAFLSILPRQAQSPVKFPRKRTAFTLIIDPIPIALTSVPVKISEQFLLSQLHPLITSDEALLQFAYRANRSVKGGILFCQFHV